MDPAPDLRQGLQDLGLKLLPSAVPRHAHGMLAEVLAAGARAPGNWPASRCAATTWRNARARVCWAADGAVALAGLAGLVLQGKAPCWAAPIKAVRRQQARRWCSRPGASVTTWLGARSTCPLLRLAMDVQQKELQKGIDPTQQLWMLGQLMQAHPQAQLVRTEQALRDEACARPCKPARGR